MSQTYKGREITFDVKDETWHCEHLSDKSYKTLCTLIETELISHEAKKTEHAAYLVSAKGTRLSSQTFLTIREVVITSVIPKSSEAWIRNVADGSRQKVMFHQLALQTTENDALAEEAQTCVDAAMQLATDAFSSTDQMRRFDLKQIQ